MKKIILTILALIIHQFLIFFCQAQTNIPQTNFTRVGIFLCEGDRKIASNAAIKGVFKEIQYNLELKKDLQLFDVKDVIENSDLIRGYCENLDEKIQEIRKSLKFLDYLLIFKVKKSGKNLDYILLTEHLKSGQAVETKQGKAAFEKSEKKYTTNIDNADYYTIVNKMLSEIYSGLSKNDNSWNVNLDRKIFNKGIITFNRGVELMESGQVEVGLKELNNVLKITKNFRSALIYLAKYYILERFDYDKAIFYLQQILNSRTKDGRAIFWKAQALYFKGEIEKALLEFERAKNFIPSEPQSFIYSGLIYKEMNDFNSATANYEKAVQLDSQNASIWYELACIYSITNDKIKSINALREAIEIGGEEFRKMAKTDSELDNVKKEKEFKELMK